MTDEPPDIEVVPRALDDRGGGIGQLDNHVSEVRHGHAPPGDEVKLLAEEVPASVQARRIRPQDSLDRVVDEREIEDLLAAVQGDRLTAQGFRHELRDHALRQIALASID